MIPSLSVSESQCLLTCVRLKKNVQTLAGVCKLTKYPLFDDD